MPTMEEYMLNNYVAKVLYKELKKPVRLIGIKGGEILYEVKDGPVWVEYVISNAEFIEKYGFGIDVSDVKIMMWDTY